MIDVRQWNLPFRIGTTSYIVPADLLPNAEFLAAHVQDMQLVLFAVPGGPSNLPDPQAVAALAALGRSRDLSYTVHLLEDLRLHDDGAAPAHALVQAREVIDLTRPLDPRAWVCHLDGRSVRDLPALSSASAPTHARWVEETALALQEVCAWAGSGARVAIENLEGYPPEFVTPVVARTSAGRCLDVGHLWLDGIDPLPHLAAALPRLQVIHLHGVRPAPETTIAGPAAALQDSRDHNSLAYADPGELDRVLAALLRARYTGILCLEVFGEDDFWSSLAALGAAVDRVCREGEAGPWAGI